MSDKRLIDANALRQKIEKWADSADNSISFADSVESFAYDEVLDAIDAAPTIDPEALQPVAHWVCEEDYDGDPVVGRVLVAKILPSCMMARRRTMGLSFAPTVAQRWRNNQNEIDGRQWIENNPLR